MLGPTAERARPPQGRCQPPAALPLPGVPGDAGGRSGRLPSSFQESSFSRKKGLDKGGKRVYSIQADGRLAQLVAHPLDVREVTSSSLVSSTTETRTKSSGFFFFYQKINIFLLNLFGTHCIPNFFRL